MSKECGSEGAFSILCVTSAGAELDANSERYDFVQEDLALRERIVGLNSINGILDLSAAHRREGEAFVVGRIMMSVSPKELDNWLPRLLRGTETENIHTPGTLSPEFDVHVKRDDAAFKYTNCQVSSWMVRSSAGGEGDPQLLQLMMTVIGYDEASITWPGTVPPPPSQDVLFWLQGDSSLTFLDNGADGFATSDVIDDASWPFESFNFVMDHNLVPKFRNSLRPICIRSMSRRTRMQVRMPLSAESAAQLHFNRIDCGVNLAFQSSVNLDNSDSSTVFSMPRMFGEKRSPKTRGRTETFLDLDLQGYPGSDPVASPVISITNTFPGHV